MTLRNIAGLYLVRLRGRLGQELLALVGIAAGVALLFAALVANTSLGGSFDRLTAGVVGDAQFQLAARGSATLDESLLAEVKRLPGVERAAATLERRGEARGAGRRRSVNLLGVTPEFGQLGGTFTRGFSYDFLKSVRLIAVPAPLAGQLALSLWQPVPLVLGDRVVEARLGAKLSRTDIGAAVDSPFVVAPARLRAAADRSADNASHVCSSFRGRARHRSRSTACGGWLDRPMPTFCRRWRTLPPSRRRCVRPTSRRRCSRSSARSSAFCSPSARCS